MRRLSISSFVVTVLGVLVLAGLLLNSGSRTAEGTFGVADGGAGTVAQVAIDMDPTGNPVGAGLIPSIETTATIPVSTSTTIQIVVDDIAAIDGMSGFSYNLLYDDSLISITAKSFASSMLSTSLEIDPDEGPAPSDPCDGADGPDTDAIIDDGCFGNFRMDAGVVGGFATGEGVLVDLTLTCGPTAGESFLDLTDIAGGDGIPDILDGANFGAPLVVGADGDASIACGATPPVGPIDVEITTETINGPASMAVNTPTTYTVNKTIDSDSLTAVAVTLGTGIIPPADCTAYADAGTYADPIDSSPVAITGVGVSTPLLSPATDATVTTAVAHGFSTGDTVIVSGVSGAVTEVSSTDVNHIHTVGATTATTFDLVGVRTIALGGAGSVSRVIGTSVGALTSAGATPSVTFGLECSAPSFHEVEVSNEIFLDAPKTYGTCDIADNCSDPTATNSVSHSTSPGAAVTPAGANGTTELGGTTGEKMEVAVTAASDADIVTSSIDLSNLTDTDNAVAGDELKKGESVSVTVNSTVTLTSSDIVPVTHNLTTTAAAPAGCTVTPASDTDPLVFSTVGETLPAAQVFSISCTVAGVSPTFLKTWTFDLDLVPDDPDGHIVDADADHADVDPAIAVIEPFVPDMNVQQSSTDDPATTTVLPGGAAQCLTTLGCEQLFEDTMGPGDPFASVMYVDFPKTSPGYTIATSGATDGSIVVGELLDTTTIVYEPLAGGTCGAPSSATVAATVDLTEVTATPLPVALQGVVGSVNALVRYNAFISNFGGSGAHLDIDIVVEDLGSSYRQWRIVNDGDLGSAWGTTICSGDIDYDILGLAGAGPTNIRSCDDAGTHTFDSTWTRDDTGGTYTDTIDVDCSAADVSVTLNKDEIVGDGTIVDPPDSDPDVVNQGVATTRNVTVLVSGPPDTKASVSIVGPVECAPQWVSPAGAVTSVLGGIQTSVVEVDPIGAGAFVFTYEITCSPAGNYSLQIVANVSSVSAGAEANTLNNQAENVVQVIVLADSDGDGVPSPQDNCPNVPNPNQNDADSDGEGNVCDINDDNDFVPILANAVPPVVAPAVDIYDNPIAIPLGGPFFAGPDQCNPGVDLLGGGPDLDALDAATLALWQEDNDDFVVEQPDPFAAGFPGIPNFALDLDGCADTDMNVTVDKAETYSVNVSENTAKTVTITVTNGNAAVGGATINILALSRSGKCEVRLVAEAGDLYSEFETDELTLLAVDGPGGADDYDPTPDGILDTLQSQLQISTGPMAAGEVLELTRDYTIHCFQPSDQYWWDSIKENPPSDFNFDATFELQVDVLPDAPVVEENLGDNVHKNFPLVTSLALADVKYTLNITGPTEIPLGELVDITGFNEIHNNGPAPTDFVVLGNWITPPGCSLFLGGGLIKIPPGVDTSLFLGPLGFPILQPAGTPLPPSVAISDPIAADSSKVICIQPSFHNVITQLTIIPQWPVTVAAPETGAACQNFIDDDLDGITNDGCPQHITDPDLSNNTSAFVSEIAAIGATQLHAIVDLSAVPATGVVSEDEFFNVTKTFFQTIDAFYNPFLPEDGVDPDFTTFPPFVPCADGADNGDSDGFDDTDADCFQGALPGSSIYPLITETLTPPSDCAVSFHVTNGLLAAIMGGAAGLTISIDGIPQSPPTPAGWEASDVVLGNQGQSVSIDFKIEVGGLSLLGAPFNTVIEENWDKHCYAPSTHNFVLNTSWTMSDMDDPHLPYDDGNQDDPFSEDVFADSDLKIVTDFFLDLQDLGTNNWLATYVPANGAAETGNDCEDGVDNDSDGVVNDGCPTEGHQKEALHNNGPYGPTATTVTIVATPSTGCDITYDVRGDEASINDGATPAAGTVVGADGDGDIDVEFPATLPVSTDVWFAELWRFSSNVDECSVTIDKNVDADDIHIVGSADFSKTVVVCLDNDDDGVHNSGGTCNGPDNCPDAANPGQEDTDNDGLGDACDDDPNRPPDDGVVKYVIAIGPAFVNLSDTTGRYMWIIAEVGNIGSDPDDETVTVTMDIAESVPNGCTRDPDDANAGNGLNESMILPGQDTFTLLDEEQKFLVWRLRYECHTPATVQTFDQTVTVSIVLAGDGNPANDSQTITKLVTIR